jgi:hypothetical protein
MPILYDNKRVTSTHATSLMRRINALEKLITDVDISEQFIPGQGIGVSVRRISDGGGDAYMYISAKGTVGGATKAVAKIQKSLIIPSNILPNKTLVGGVATYLFDAGTGAGEVFDSVDFDERDGFIWITDEWLATPAARIQKFDTDGVLVAEYKINTIQGGFGVKSRMRSPHIRSDGVVLFEYWEDRIVSLSPTVRQYAGGIYKTPSAITPVVSFTATASGLDHSFITLTSNDEIVVKKLSTGQYFLYNNGGGLSHEIVVNVPSDSFNVIGTLPNTELVIVNLYTSGTNQDSIIVTDDEGNYKRTLFSNPDNPPGVSLLDIERYIVFTDDGTNTWWWNSLGGSGGLVIKGSTSTTTYDQTEFFRYPDKGALTNPESLGTPDAGVTIPALTALQALTNGDAHRPHYGELDDIRLAIEAIVPFFVNAVTGDPFNITPADADNIFTLAIDAGQDDWTTPVAASGERMRATDLSDIDLVLELLEASDLA